MWVIYTSNESLGTATWVRRVLGLTLSLLHKPSRGTGGLAGKSLCNCASSALAVQFRTLAVSWGQNRAVKADYRVSSREVEPGLEWLPRVPHPSLIATLNLDSFQLREVQGLGVDSQEFEVLWGPFIPNFLSHPLTKLFPSIHSIPGWLETYIY